MPGTLVDLVQAARTELGLFPIPAVVASSLDDTDKMMMGLANALGRELIQDRDWTGLQTEWIITTNPPTIQTGTLTAGSTIITGLSDTSGLAPGLFFVAGQGIPSAARLVSVDSATQVTITEASTSSLSTSITFAQDLYPLPLDLERPINRTHWDRTNHWELIGPISPQVDEWIRSGIVTTGPRRRFRMIGNLPYAFRIWPPPTATDSPATLALEYVTKFWVNDAAGERKEKFTADTDRAIFPDALMIAGIKLKWMQAKLFDTTAVLADYLRVKSIVEASDGGAATLSTRRRRANLFISPGNVQDGYFPSRP